MAGIGDVQPKSINIPQMVGDNPPVATQSAVAALMDAYHKGFVTTNDILAHPGGNALMQASVDKAKMTAEQQQLGEAISPEAVQARKSKIALEQQQANELLDPEAIAARKEAQRLVSEKTEMERETMQHKEFIAAWKEGGNATLYRPDGKPDYKAMSEGGQKYLEHKRVVAYAQAGLDGKPVNYFDENNIQHTIYRNSEGRDVTPLTKAGEENIKYYQKLLNKSLPFLLQNNLEPNPESSYKVTPKDIVDEPMSPMITALAPAPVVVPTPAPPGIGMGLGNTTRRFLDAGDVFAPAAPAAAAPVVAPKVTVAPTGEVTVQPDPNQGLQTSKSTEVELKPDDLVKDARATEYVKNFTEKSSAIDSFRMLKASYEKLGSGAVTSQNDLALANAAMQIASMSASGGSSRGAGQELKRIEDSIPLIERILDIPDIVLMRDKFPEGVRNRLIEITEQKAQAVEALAGDMLNVTAKRLKANGLEPASYLSEREMSLISRHAAAPATGADAGAGGGGIEKTVTLGGKTYRVRQ